ENPIIGEVLTEIFGLGRDAVTYGVARPHVPDPHCTFGTGRDEPRAVGAKRHAVDLVAMATEGGQLLTGGRVPQLDTAVLAPRRQAVFGGPASPPPGSGRRG